MLRKDWLASPLESNGSTPDHCLVSDAGALKLGGFALATHAAAAAAAPTMGDGDRGHCLVAPFGGCTAAYASPEALALHLLRENVTHTDVP